MSNTVVYFVIGLVFSFFYVKKNILSRTGEVHGFGVLLILTVIFLVCAAIWPVLLLVDIVIFILMFLGKLSSK